MESSQSPGQPALYYQGRHYPLNRSQMIIGSDPGCDIRIENNPRVLSMHAQLIVREGQVFLMYMERGAGIWVNGAPASQQQLQDQDVIALGDGETRLKLLLNWNGAGAQTDVSAEGTQIMRGPASASLANARPYAAGLGAQPAVAPAMGNGQMPPVTPPLGGAQPLRAAQAPMQQMGFAAQAQPGQQAAFAPQPVPQSATPASNTATNTTRYLCAAGHLDEDFQDYVLRNVIHEERRALGESYGVDMLAVVSWCKAGLARINIRDSILTFLLSLHIIIPLILFLSALRASAPTAPTYNQYPSNYPYSTPSPPSFNILSLLPLGMIAIVLLIAAFVSFASLIFIFSLEKWVKRRWPKSHPGIISLLTVPWALIPPLGPILFWLGWLVGFIELLVRFYGKATNQLRKHTFNQQYRPVPLDFTLETKLRESFSTNQRNVVAYSGDKPFAGAGDYLTGWSFVVDTSKGAPLALDLSGENHRQTPVQFTTHSLYEAVEKDARTLGFNELEIESKLYVRGQYLPEHSYFFNPNTMRPVTSVDQKVVDFYKENSTEDIRYYQCLRFNAWRGEVVFTAFLRLIQRGKSLFIEFDYLLLPPMLPDYYWVDEREIMPTLGKVWQLFLRSFDRPVQTMLLAPFRLFRGPLYTARQNRLVRVARNNPAFDYGAVTSLRHKASDDDYHLFFQKLDQEMYLKSVQKQMLETIYTFLKDHQIDTSEFNRQQQAIINSGTIVSGGSVHIGAMATGSGGQAFSAPAQPQPRP